MTLLVRDEADVIDAHVAFHLNAGVDHVLAIDHASQDGTTEMLSRYARGGQVHVIHEEGPMREQEWRTQLARLAAIEFGADWVISSDADQFWWPCGGDLKQVLAAIPAGRGALVAFDRVFVPRPDDGTHFAERMTSRLFSMAPINAPASTYRPLPRLIHRGSPEVVVSRGGHAISNVSLSLLNTWHPIDVLHFPWRSSTQMQRKAKHLWSAFEAGSRRATEYHAEAYRAVQEGRTAAHYSALAVAEICLQRGLAEGSLICDTRLRDALRVLCGTTPIPQVDSSRFSLPPNASGLSFPARSTVDDAACAVEAAVLREAEITRARRRLDGLESQIASLEATR